MEQSPFWKPKFIQAAFAQITVTIALFTHHLDPATYRDLTVIILGMFTTASVVENKIVQQPASKS